MVHESGQSRMRKNSFNVRNPVLATNIGGQVAFLQRGNGLHTLGMVADFPKDKNIRYLLVKHLKRDNNVVIVLSVVEEDTAHIQVQDTLGVHHSTVHPDLDRILHLRHSMSRQHLLFKHTSISNRRCRCCGHIRRQFKVAEREVDRA